MTSLKDLQARFQAGILSGDNSVLADIKDSACEDRSVLFGVYRNAYVLRLVEVLGNDYEITHAYVGDATFDGLARAYVSAHPSDQKNARWFGRHLPSFAKHAVPFSSHPEIGEIAALEKALADAFDGPDGDTLTTDDLANLAPEVWPTLTFTPHPTAVRLHFTTNAAEIWSALHEEITPPKPKRLPEPQTVLVWRQEFMSHFRSLQAEEAMMWTEAAKGVPFGALCEMVAIFAGEDEADLRAATYLKTWVDAGLLAEANLLAAQPASSAEVSSGAGNSALERPESQ